ncbi:MAG: Long-chain-alcohol dehydrogenase 1 [Candidatus Celerinatantimonas neptuna]|nr:MAG: Long-chain-alcohol dehydrogenase 1 [Candidatus Celerinatantimonas neptuna]
MSFNSFSFTTVPDIHLEWGGASQLGALLSQRFAARKLLLVTDAGLIKAGLIEPVQKSLTESGFDVLVYDDVVADPAEYIVRGCAELACSKGIDIVLGLGGGSSLDTAKLVSVLIGSDQDLSDMYGIDNVTGHRVTLALVPTTSGTGSEVTNISIITTGETTKMGVVARQLYADFVLLDAELTVGLPAIHTSATGIDAMVHAIEAYTSKFKKNPLSDALAREALRLLAHHLIPACKDGQNREARENVLLGAMLAGQAFNNSPVAAVHALAYPLGGNFHLPHGLTNALMLGPVLRFNAKVAAPLYAELADAVGIPGEGDAQTRSAAFVDFMLKLMDESGAPRRLRDVNVTEESLPMLAEEAMKQTRLLVNNPVEVTQGSALELYREAF